MKRIFISGPYTKGDVAQNVKNSMDSADALINAGFAPYCPHLTHFLHMNAYQEYETWLKLDLAYLEICNGLLRLPGESNGADKEVEFAVRNGIPVFHSHEELISYFKKEK
ncbi:DUF4406 domain-containing protein [Pedobacter sp. P26]|uniref:DUF7768 domain-containing protein n=1 Tax=Pedobacter sp. P26 TaxID=3423956 RepID=UPI003D669393